MTKDQIRRGHPLLFGSGEAALNFDEGWNQLVAEWCDEMEWHLCKIGPTRPWVNSIYSTSAGIRFRFSGKNLQLESMAISARIESLTVCEYCGTNKIESKVRPRIFAGSKICCDECASKNGEALYAYHDLMGEPVNTKPEWAESNGGTFALRDHNVHVWLVKDRFTKVDPVHRSRFYAASCFELPNDFMQAMYAHWKDCEIENHLADGLVDINNIFSFLTSRSIRKTILIKKYVI